MFSIIASSKSLLNVPRNLANFGTSTVGALASQGIKDLLTSQKNKVATKGVINNLTKLFTRGRYRKVLNGSPDFEEKLPFFDLETSTVIFLSFTS